VVLAGGVPLRLAANLARAQPTVWGLARPLPPRARTDPVQITDHIGDSSAKALLAEVLLMTKMNWNSARFAEKLPVTLRFANEVGTILRDLPGDYTPEARYAFYM
jgi:hypothetical protein